MKKLMQKISWQNEYQKLLLESMKVELKGLPEGYLIPKKIGGKNYTYLRESRNEFGVIKPGADKIVNRHNFHKAEALLRRRFLEKSIRKLEKSVARIDNFMCAHIPYDPQEVYDSICRGTVCLNIEKYFLEECGMRKAVALTDESNLDYIGESKKHVTPKGTRVRSKSEALIAGILELYGLDYQYEKRLLLGRKSFYPDFTLANVLSGETIYWEHFGLIHDPIYRKTMVEKLSVYEENGILPWKNLVITFDSEDGSIDMQRIHRILCNMAGLEPLL